MKKLLLSMTAVAAMSMVASAEVVTLDFTKPAELNASVEIPTTVSTGTDVTDVAFSKDGVSVSTTMGTSNAPMLFLTTSNATQYRIYKGAVMTITADKTISQIVLNCGNTNFTTSNATVDTGSFTASSKVTTWTGSSEKVVFTIGSSANMQINSIEVTVGDGGSENPENPETPETPDTPTTTTIYSVNFLEGQGDWTINNQVLPDGLTYVWAYNSTYGMKASAYANSTTYAVESWLISPVIDLTSATSPALTYSQAGNYFTDLATFLTEATVWAREEGDEWAQLTLTDNLTALSWSFVDTKADLSAYAGKKMQIAFKYTSTAAKSGTWEIKNLTVTGSSNAGVNEVVVDENAPVVFYNLQGVRVANPENGVFVRVQGNKVSKVLVK